MQTKTIRRGAVRIVKIKSNRHRLHRPLNRHAPHRHPVRLATRNTFPAVNHLNSHRRLCRRSRHHHRHRKVVPSINRHRPSIIQNRIRAINRLESFRHRYHRMAVVAVVVEVERIV